MVKTEEKDMKNEESFEEYARRLRSLEIRAEMHRDGFFRDAPKPKSEPGVLF